MDDNKAFQDIISRSTVAVITDKNGNKTRLTPVQAAQAGISDRIPATGTKPIFQTSEGWSFDVADAPASIDINPETGNIRITAPKEITDSDMFKQVFDEEQLKQYSQAYKLNPEYKISVTEKNEETGAEEDKEITIPEYVERLNSSISNYMQNLRDAHNYREKLISKYGKKANNLTDEQLIKAGQEQAKALYLPDTILNVGNFGKGTNPFLQLAGLRTEDGLVSTEEFSKVYNRKNFGRDEIAAVLAAIDGTLRGSGWDKEGTYTDEEGNVYDNRNSAEEAAKLIAFRNYIVSNNPTSDNWQQMGDYIESFVDNAAYQTTKIFENLANIGEAVVTGGEGQFFQNNIEEMDEAMEYFNENNAVVWDAVTNAQIWGTLGGMALGTWGTGKLLALPFKGLSAASGALTTKYMATAARVAELADNSVKISTGAQLAFRAMTIAEKVNLGINMAMTGISGLVHRNFFTEYVFDTMHDALLYDSTGFRDMLSSMSRAAETDQKAGIALEYWIGQYADNAKWWAPMGAARALVKTAGKTTLGKAANIILTKYINRVEAKIGTKFQGAQDNLGGGTVIAKLEEKLQKAEDAGATTKANRIKKQIQQENFNIQLRAAREQIGNVKLDWDGVRLTEESAQEWKNAMTRLKAIENGIDLYNGGVDAQTRAMLNAIIDPATGKPGFLYEELAGANIKASQWYFKLVDLNKKYGLGIAPKSLINQEVIDYWQGSFKQRIYQAFADSGTENGAKAAAALPTVEENLASLRATLPEEITKFIDEGLDQKVYQGFYRQLNKFGMDEKLLVRSTVEGYENNPIWVENGYMPISLDVDPGGRWISEDDKIETIIEQEMDKLVFGATAGEHFRDPELVRQVRIRHMAQAKVNDEIWKSYSGWGSNATNVTVISGEETEFAKQVQAGQKAMQEAIARQASGAFSENLTANIVKTKRRKVAKNAQVDAETKETVISSMSRSDTSWYLSQGKYSPLKTPQSKLTDGVTAKNYDEWYDEQSGPVKRYLSQQNSAETFENSIRTGVKGTTVYRAGYVGDGLETFYKKTRREGEELLSDSFLRDKLGVPNPKGFKDFLDAHKNEINAVDEYDLVDQGLAWYKQSKMDSVFYSEENQEFLETLGMPTEYEAVDSSSRAAGKYRYYSGKDYDTLELNSNYILSLPELQAVELHEAAHAAWVRASSETQMRVSQDLLNRLGVKLTVDERLACSKEMNELIAYATQARFETQQGIESIMNDKVFKKHLSALAKKAGVDLTPTFKEKVTTLIKSFVAFIETKLLGINEAKTFDDFYNGLLSGNFADDIGNNISPYIKRNFYKSKWGSFSSEIKDSAGAKIEISGKPSTVQNIDVAVKPSYAKFSEMVQKGGDDFETGLQRAYLMGNKAFGKSSLLNEATKNVKAGKDAFYEGVLAAKMKGELKGILNVDTDQFVDDMLTSIRGMVDDYVAGTAGAPGAAEAVKALAETTDGANAAARYSVLQELLKKENLDKAKKALFDQVEELRKGKNLNSDWVDLLHKKTEEMLVDVIKTERDSARAAARTFNAELTDSQTLFDEVSDINKRIIKAEKRVGTDYVMYLDDEGRKVYAQVDPAFASLFNYRYKMEKAEANVVARINGLMSKAFRYGTTSVNLSSFGNQLFRDFGNAIFVGGAWQTIKTSADDLVTVFGQRIVDQIKQFEPEEYKRTEAMAEQTGRTLEQTAVSRELMRGAAMAPSSTERTLYKTFMKKAYGQDVDTVLKKAQNKFQEFVDKHNPDDLLNGKRENYLRNRVFAANLDDAMKQGYTLQQARVFADFAMNNATTNFGRQLYHLQAIADSTPYFRAAINGTKSFWRMWTLDPVGITGRIMGGLILPTVYLTGMSLGDEESRAIYMNIQEHQKQNSMVFVFNGQAVSVPIPQELGAIVSPFRQFVEYLHDSNKNDFWELMMNDLLGLSPIDLQGFSTIDMDQMISDPTIFDRLSRGFARVFSEIAPIPVKSAYMLATGTDPYTGRSLQDTSYVTYNEETGSLEVMDYNENAFAKLFASWFGGSISPKLAEELISGLIGSTGSNILGDLTRLAQEGPEAALQSAGKNITEQIKKPFDVNEYDYTTAVWKRAISQLTTEKKAILDSKEMQTYNSALAQTKNPDERKKILAQRQTLVDGFEQKVKDTVERLSSVYGGTLDRQKLAAVINLLNFNSDPGYQSGSQYSSNVASESFWDGRDAAVHTLERMGVSGAGDTSIFGYLTVDKDGNPIVKYTSPIAIMDMENQWKNQDDIHAANVKALVSENNIYDAHEAVKKQIDAIYGSKSKLTNQDYANIDAIKINWNAELAKTIAPYVSQMTPEAAINNNDVMNALYPYVEVPNSWEVNNKGKSVSLGDRGNKKKAYYDSWIKSLFSVNDPYKGQY